MAINFNEINTDTLELINIKLKDVLLNALYETIFIYTSYNEEVPGPDNYTTPENIILQKNKLKELICELPQQLKVPADQRDAYIKTLTDYRAGLIDDFYALNLYLYRVQQIKDLYVLQAKYNSIDFDTSNINSEAFLSYVEQLTAEVEKLEEQGPFMMGELMALFPLRMTKAKYTDYVRAGLTKLLEGLNGGFLENTVKMFKAKINPLVAKEYGTIMPYIKEGLEELSANDLNELDSKAFEECLTDIDGIEETIGYTLNTYSILYNIIVYITALCQFCINDEYIFENDLQLKDMLYATVEMLKADDPDIYAETLEKTIGDMIEDIFELSSPKEKKFDKALKKLSKLEDGEIPEDTVVSINVYTALSRTFIVEIIDELSGVHNDNEANLTIAEAVEEIVEFIGNSLNDYSLPQQKLIKQRLLGDMPSPLDAKESYEYMSYAFDGISDTKKKIMCMGDVLETTDPDDDHSHHHHDCECGCGEHHHDHDCECGHEHHHDHDCGCGHHH